MACEIAALSHHIKNIMQGVRFGADMVRTAMAEHDRDLLGIVRETLNILLEGTPRDCSVPDIRAGMQAVEGVINVHDLHVWSLGSQSHALACHIQIDDIPPSESNCILLKINSLARENFHIHHTTIQFEHAGCEVLDGCVVPIGEMAADSARGHHHDHSHSHAGHTH